MMVSNVPFSIPQYGKEVLSLARTMTLQVNQVEGWESCSARSLSDVLVFQTGITGYKNSKEQASISIVGAAVIGVTMTSCDLSEFTRSCVE